MSRLQKSETLYPHPFSRAYWRDAALELKDTRMLVFAALMIALRLVLKLVYIPLAPNLKINTAFLANALGASVFGPVMAAICAIITDVLGYLLNPEGVYFVPFVLTEVAGSVVFALCLYRTKLSTARVMLSRFCICFFVNVVLQTPIMMWYYSIYMGGKSYVLTLPSIAKNVFMFPLETVALTLFLSVMQPITYRMKLTFDPDAKLKFSKKQVVALALLFVIGVGCVSGYFVYNYNTSNQASWLQSEEKVELNTAATESARKQGLIQNGEILIVKRVNKKLGGDTQVEFVLCRVSEKTNLEKAMGYRSTDLKEDASLTTVGSATATLVRDDTGKITGITVKYST